MDTFLLEKLGAFQQQFFTSWNASAMTAKLIVDGRAVNLSDEKGLRVLCLLLFRGQSDYIDILSKKLSKNM